MLSPHGPLFDLVSFEPSPRTSSLPSAWGVSLVIGWCLLVLPLKASSSQPTSESEGSRSSQNASEEREPPTPNLEGQWAQKIVQTSLTDLPVLGDSTTETITYLLVEIEQSNRELELTSQVCDMKIESDLDAFETIVPDAFVESLPISQREGEIVRRDGEFEFRVERQLEVRGARLRNPDHEYLPEDPDDRRVRDPDDDGHPGLTLRIDGAVSGDMYVVQRGWDRYTGRVRSETHMTGRVEWQSEQRVLGSTSMFLRSQPPTRPHPDASKSWIEFVRLDGSANCETVLSSRDQLF